MAENIDAGSWNEHFDKVVQNQLFDAIIYTLLQFPVPGATVLEIQRLIDNSLRGMGTAGEAFLPGGKHRQAIEINVAKFTT